jgi:chemotaxis protein methyltransferase CheR
VTPYDFDFIRKLLKQRSGLTLSAEKQYLVESRLMPLAQRTGLTDLAALTRKLRSGDEALTVDVVEAMTTNETFFFRDKLPFEHFKTFIMPSLLATRARHKRIRIWCAAASTGQEPYSFAMMLKEMGRQVEDFRIEIVATDISQDVLEKAKSGIYSQFEVQRGLPIQMLIKYFKQDGEMWQIAPEIRAMVQFRPLNLLADFGRNGIFDLVVCRNVLIYFDQETKTEVIDRLARVIAPDGYLILGAAETTIGLSQGFKAIPERRGLYAPVDPSMTPADRVMTRLAVAGTQLASRL